MPTPLSAHRGAILAMVLTVAVTVAAVPLSLVARTSFDEEYRACMSEAGVRREEDTLEAYREYHRRVEESMERKRDAVREAWTIEDDAERGDRLREADRAATREEGEARNDLYARNREISAAQWDAQRECERGQRERQREDRDREREEREREREEERRRREEERSSSSVPSEEPREEEPLSCDEREDEVQRIADENAACQTDDDCRMVEQSCPFVTCGVAVNAGGELAVRDAAAAAAQCMTDSGEPIPCAGCMMRTPFCDAGRCALR